MVDLVWLGSLAAGAICIGAGILGWAKNPKSKAATLFMAAMVCVLIAMVTGPMLRLIERDGAAAADSVAKVFLVSFLLALTFLWELTLIFPKEREVRVLPPDRVGAVIMAGIAVAVALGLLAQADHIDSGAAVLSGLGLRVMLAYAATTIVTAMVLILSVKGSVSEERWSSGARYLIGLWILAVGAMPYAADGLSGSSFGLVHDMAYPALIVGVTVSGLVFAFSIATGEFVMMAAPRAETVISSSKTSYKLLHRRVYLVEEEKPEFSFEMFADILKGRCFDCENDDSFPCESLECTTCRLPCPCRECEKYNSRAQGMIVTRQHPNNVRSEHFIQTTPILWLSTVAGKDNMDPAKISLLTDYLVNFMERSSNGVVLVDGIEYMVTSNDFQKVLKALDRWTETAMTSRSRLVLTVDPRAFSEKELALLEKNKEVVRPHHDSGLEPVVG